MFIKSAYFSSSYCSYLALSVSPLMCMCCSDGVENIIFEEDDEDDEGYLFAGQGRPSRNYLMLSYHFILYNIYHP
jgi:hypothetical protein